MAFRVLPNGVALAPRNATEGVPYAALKSIPLSCRAGAKSGSLAEWVQHAIFFTRQARLAGVGAKIVSFLAAYRTSPPGIRRNCATIRARSAPDRTKAENRHFPQWFEGPKMK